MLGKSSGAQAVGILIASIGDERPVTAIAVVTPHWMPVGGIGRRRGAVDGGVGDGAGLGVGALPDVLPGVLRGIKLHGETQIGQVKSINDPTAVLLVPPLASTLRFVLLQVDLVLPIAKPAKNVWKAAHELVSILLALLLLNRPSSGF